MRTWQPNRVLKVLLIWSALTFIIFWLPAIRGVMDGPSYEWGNFFGFSGSGTTGDYWFPVFASALAIGFLGLGYRGARMPFSVILLGWHGLLAAGASWAALQYPENFRFRGDTLGVDIPLAWMGPVIFGGFFLLAVYWVLRYRPRESEAPPQWSNRNRIFFWIVLSLLPVQFLLLRFGEPHGATDQFGVLLTLVQWALISAALYPWRTRPSRVAAPSSGRRAEAVH